MKNRVNCWVHRWGKWQRVDVTLVSGAEITQQFRECGRCGLMQTKGFS